MFNVYLELFRSGLAANLPTASLLDYPTVPRQYYATDTNALYVYSPATLAWELLYQLKPVTFANLPVVGKIAGSEALVSDATAPAKGSVIAGGGAILTGAVWDGAAWRAV